MDPDPRSGRSSNSPRSRPPVDHGADVVPTTSLVTDSYHPGVSGSVLLSLDEPLDQGKRLLTTRLLGEAGYPPIGEGDRRSHPPQVPLAGGLLELGFHVPPRLLDEVLQKRRCMKSMRAR